MNKRIALAVLIICLLIVGLGFTQSPSRVQWEYMTTSNTTAKKLNELGAQGWELVSVESLVSGGTYISSNAYLKRPKLDAK